MGIGFSSESEYENIYERVDKRLDNASSPLSKDNASSPLDYKENISSPLSRENAPSPLSRENAPSPLDYKENASIPNYIKKVSKEYIKDKFMPILDELINATKQANEDYICDKLYNNIIKILNNIYKPKDKDLVDDIIYILYAELFILLAELKSYSYVRRYNNEKKLFSNYFDWEEEKDRIIKKCYNDLAFDYLTKKTNNLINDNDFYRILNQYIIDMGSFEWYNSWNCSKLERCSKILNDIINKRKILRKEIPREIDKEWAENFLKEDIKGGNYNLSIVFIIIIIIISLIIIIITTVNLKIHYRYNTLN
jgi:hypothetical protein